MGTFLGAGLVILMGGTGIQAIKGALARVEEEKKNRERRTRATFGTIAAAIDAKDNYTGGHSDRVGSYFMQGLVMVVIPLWAAAVFVFPPLREVSNWLFILPLLWLEIMIIVEKQIHKKAQRTAMELDELEREHDKKLRKDF